MRLALVAIALLLSGILTGVIAGHFLTQYARPDQRAAVDRLDARIDRIEFHNIPLRQVVERLNQECNARIGVDWRVLETAGVRPETPIFVQTQGLPLRRVLDLVCADAGSGQVKLSYRASDDGIVFLSTADNLSRETIVRIYDVRDLIEYDHDLRDRMHRLMFQSRESKPEESAEKKPDSVESLVKLITETIDPDTWRDAGGTTGSIREFGGRLIIIQTAEAHTRIAALIDKLEKGT